MTKTNLLVSTAVGLAFVVAGPSAMAVGKKHAPQGNAKAHAHVNFATMPFKTHKGVVNAKGTGLKEKFMVETWSVTTVDLFGGTVTEDSAQTINCKKACTVVTLNTAEVLSYYSYNQVGICPVVDGYMTNGACFFSGALSLKDLYRNETNQTNLAVGAGTHTLQTYLYTLAPAYLGHYQNDYHIYE
jgi:hypothetical protein